MRAGKLKVIYFADAMGFIRLANIDVDNLIFLLKTLTDIKHSKLPTSIMVADKFLARPLLLLKCLVECLEKYFKTILLATGKFTYEEVGFKNHNLRELWRNLPDKLEIRNKFYIYPKREIRRFGIGTKRRAFDLLDIDYSLLRYEGAKKTKHTPSEYSAKIALTSLHEAAKKIDYNLTFFHDNLLALQRLVTPKVPASTLRKTYKAFHRIKPKDHKSNIFEAIVENDEFRIRIRP